ncbi:uncharacterized protein LOC110095948 [Dendrobium catenatum]|uniref:uncharacterized protein LOC110095948 n=1 Tax=Dendrobium catenatum TaxID=906689 RepID=UPI00109F5099|nr:uncharacterized protein LOC110095948 [Dendrobium catenatum]
MRLANDQDDTQVLDVDSPHSGGGDVFMAGETVPLDCGETQRVDSGDEQFGEGFENWGQTQVMDEFEETEVVRDEDEDGGGQSERTELVTDEEELGDDFVGEVEPGVRTKDADLVDPDASTDEEGGCGSGEPECSRKNFVATPIAALQSSGFANVACVPIGKKLESSTLADENFNTHNHEKVEGHTLMKASWMETIPCSESNLNTVGTNKDEIALDHEAENSSRFIEGYSGKTLYQEEETELRSELNKEILLSQSPQRCNIAAAGLSYISSQEPGVQSQAIALGVVDKFLSLNSERLSPDINNENMETVLSLPIASVKRAQCLVRKSDKSTEKVHVYDWIDAIEDEGGGELFSRRKNSFFECKGSKQVSRRLPSEAILRGSEMINGVDNKSSTKSKDLFNDLKEQTNRETMEQLEKSDIHVSDEGVYNFGPDTQMAVEAIQALGHSSPVHFEPTNPQSKHGQVTSTSIKIKKTNRTCSRNAPTRKKINESEGIITRSKRQSNITKSRTKSCNSSSKQSTKLRTKMVFEDLTTEITAKITVKKSNENHKGQISVNNGEYAEIMKNMVDKELEKSPVPVTLCKQPSVGVNCAVGTSEKYTSPVAHRTRRSKATELLNLNKTLSNGPGKDTSRMNLRSHRTLEMKDEFVSNTSVVPKINKNGRNLSLNVTIQSACGFSGLADAVEVEREHVEETAPFHDRDAYSESKRRKMKNIDTENKKSVRKMNNHSKSLDVIAPTDPKPTIQMKKRKVFIRSFAEILDTVKRRKRSVSSSSKFESDGITSNFGKMRNESGFRTRPSLLSDILKPYFANDARFKDQLSCKAASDGTSNTCSVSSVKQVVNNHNLETSKESVRSRLLAEVVKEDTKPDGSANAISQSGLPCSPAAGGNVASPVCNPHDSSRISFRKSLSGSPISRELIRLEASYASPSKLNEVRRRKDMACFQVCFSNHLSKDVINHQKKILKRLGIQDVSSSIEATHFVADKFVRTRNMLEAMAMGKPVVTPMWLESCGQVSSFIDEKNYILRDVRKEKEIGFSMPVSLARACQHPLLQGKRVFITRNARPNQELISSLVKVAGGQPLKRIELSMTEEDKQPDNLLILTGEEDFAVCEPLLEKGAAAFSSELLLNGIVVQKLEYERHQLFLNQVKMSH